jgi:hypothetical protein
MGQIIVPKRRFQSTLRRVRTQEVEELSLFLNKNVNLLLVAQAAKKTVAVVTQGLEEGGSGILLPVKPVAYLLNNASKSSLWPTQWVI